MTERAVAITAVCRNCGERFERPRHGGRHKRADAPRIRSAGYCTAACRQADRRRWAIAAGVPEVVARQPRPRKVRLEAHTSVTAREIVEQNQMVKEPKTTTLGPAKRKLPRGVVRDDRYPNMYRVQLPDGSLSDMVNLTRACDAARRAA